MDIRDALERCIRTVPDFPIPGIQFRDITPVLANPTLMMQITESFAISVAEVEPTAIAGPEARGFIFGPLLAAKLDCPFIPIRNPGNYPLIPFLWLMNSNMEQTRWKCTRTHSITKIASS